MKFTPVGDLIYLESGLLRDIRSGRLKSIKISGGIGPYLNIEYLPGDANKASGFEYLDEDDL